MSKGKIAPHVQRFLREYPEELPTQVVWEIKRLIAVARAAERAANDYDEEPYGLHRALTRLRRASGTGSK